MKITKMLEVNWSPSWCKPQFDWYTYDGSDGRRVTNWMIHLGPLRIIHYRIAGQLPEGYQDPVAH